MFNEFSVCGKRACRVILILMLAIVLSFDVPVIMGQGSTAYADACIERFTDVSVGDYHLCLVTPDNKAVVLFKVNQFIYAPIFTG